MFYREVDDYKLNTLEIKTSKGINNIYFNFIIGAAELIIQIKKIKAFILFFCPVFNQIIKNIIKSVKVISYSMNESEMDYRGSKSYSVKNYVKEQRVDGN